MAQGRWKDLLQAGTLQPSAAPGWSHTLQRRVRARRTSGTTDCSLFRASTEICGGHGRVCEAHKLIAGGYNPLYPIYRTTLIRYIETAAIR